MTQAKRILLSLILAISMSVVVLPVEAFATDSNTYSSTRTQSTEVSKPKPAPSRIIKKGNNLYYKQNNGKLRTKKGFFTYDGNRYYSEKGGKIVRAQTFKVGNYYYRAYGNGKIAIGVYKWGTNPKLYYSDSKGRWVKIKSYRHQKGVKWKGKWYFLQTNSQVATKRPVVINNKPYYAAANGVCTGIALNKTNNKVVKIARKQIGKHTKTQVKGFWTWFFGTKFVDTDVTPWCGSFVGWCFKKAGQYNKIRAIGNIGYVPRYTSYANNKGKWIRKAKAKPGDLIIFGSSRHVGIVERVYKGYIYTIEGNSGPTAAIGTRKPGAVTRRVYKLSDKDIRGVMHP